MRVVIVGASGYIGAPLFRSSENFCSSLGTSTVGSKSFLRLRLDAQEDFDYKIIQDSDVVLVTAAISAPDVCAHERERAWAVNVTGTSSFISNVISRGARVIFFSSDLVYGQRMDRFDEAAACKPDGDYAVMKHEVETRFLGNPSFKTIRLSYVFSCEDKFTNYLCGCAERGVEAEIFHPFYRAVVHRDDIVEGAIALVKRWKEFPQPIFNFGGPDIISRVEFAQTLKDSIFPALLFRKLQPDPQFFVNRPSMINMTSPLFESILGRPPSSLREAAHLELDKRGKKHNG